MMKFLLSLFVWLNMSTILVAQEVAEAVAPSAPSLFSLIYYYVDMLSQGMFGLMIMATVIARLIPGTKDDEMVESLSGKLMKGMHYLPTFGINPRTKKLEEELETLKGQKKP